MNALALSVCNCYYKLNRKVPFHSPFWNKLQRKRSGIVTIKLWAVSMCHSHWLPQSHRCCFSRNGDFLIYTYFYTYFYMWLCLLVTSLDFRIHKGRTFIFVHRGLIECLAYNQFSLNTCWIDEWWPGQKEEWVDGWWIDGWMDEEDTLCKEIIIPILELS